MKKNLLRLVYQKKLKVSQSTVSRKQKKYNETSNTDNNHVMDPKRHSVDQLSAIF
jgi:hypothetical protein